MFRHSNFLCNFNVLSICVILIVMPIGSVRADDTNWERWGVHDPAQAAVPDHDAMTAVLEAFGEVNLGQFTLKYDMIEGRSVKILESYIEYLEGMPISRLNRDEQLAAWLNLYNAAAIHSIVTYRKLPNRMNILRGVPGEPGKLWRKKIFKVEGYDLSLDDIEVNILARHWSGTDDKALWIYGLTYGARGSPPLPVVAFEGKTVETLLEDTARIFIKRTKNVQVNGTVAEVSTLYGWHGRHIGPTDADVINHIKLFANDKLTAKLERATSIEANRFNWRINSFVPGSTGLAAPGQGEATGGEGGGGGGG